MTQGYADGWRKWIRALLCAVLAVGGIGPVLAQVIPASVEHVTRLSDVVVLGKITATDPEGIEVGPMRQLYTRHTMKVEAYYKGSGPGEISILTMGGFWARHEDGKDIKMMTQAVGSVGVRVGEEILVFLRAEPEGFPFIEWDGAKYPVVIDPASGERSVQLRLSKKRYMRSTALEGFKKLEAMEQSDTPTAAIEAKLSRGSFLTEMVLVRDLRGRENQEPEMTPSASRQQCAGDFLGFRALFLRGHFLSLTNRVL
jgi:hypothetical protein